jgi:hypothetical protein
LGDCCFQTGLAARSSGLCRLLLLFTFCFSLAIGKLVSLAVDGPATPLLDFYLRLEIFSGLLGLAVFRYARNSSR